MSNTRKAEAPVFDLDAYIENGAKEPYVFNFKGRAWSMTHMEELDAWQLMAMAEGGDEKAGLEVIRKAFGDEQFDEFKAEGLPQRGFNELFKRYREFCGIEEGESPASTNS